MGFETPEDAMREIAALTPHFAGVTYERLGRRGLLWPVAPDGTDAPILYSERFDVPGGLGKFAALPYKEPGDAADGEFPLILVTGRRLEHYNAGTMTRRTGNLELLDHEWLEIHPDDAARLWIEDGQLVSVRSRVGRIDVEAKVTDRIEPGHVFTAFHFPGGAHEPADRRVRGRQHLDPGVQGGRRRRAARQRAARIHAGGGVTAMLIGDERAPRMLARVLRDGERDEVAVEEPLEIRVDGSPLAVTMRTPGHDEELALGFLLTEGLIDGVHSVGLTDDFAANVIEVEGPLRRDPGARRFYTTSSCGVCGKGALAEVAVDAPRAAPGPRVPRSLLAALPDRLRQPAFQRTGGMHATGLFTADGELTLVREDVGRHNAMDKVVGRALLEGLVPLYRRILCVSGRLSFELVQKAAVAGAPILVGVGAPTSLAIELAADRGITLAGFARRGSVNVYTGAERICA